MLNEMQDEMHIKNRKWLRCRDAKMHDVKEKKTKADMYNYIQWKR